MKVSCQLVDGGSRLVDSVCCILKVGQWKVVGEWWKLASGHCLLDDGSWLVDSGCWTVEGGWWKTAGENLSPPPHQ